MYCTYVWSTQAYWNLWDRDLISHRVGITIVMGETGMLSLIDILLTSLKTAHSLCTPSDCFVCCPFIDGSIFSTVAWMQACCQH